MFVPSLRPSKALALLTGGALALLAGCGVPSASSRGNVLPDDDPLGGGVSSGDVRTMASRMCPEILALPQIAGAGGVTRIALGSFRNSTRFVIDNDLFLKRLRIELNDYGGGRIRFFAQGVGQDARREVLEGRQEEILQQSLDDLADWILAQPRFAQASEPVTVAVLPVLNANLVGLNADGFAALLRSKIAERSNGRVLFAFPGAEADVDLYLTGQFIAESARTEGIVNLLEYYALFQEKLANGEDFNAGELSIVSPGLAVHGQSSNDLGALARTPLPAELTKDPNVTKRLNVMLVDPATQLAVLERMVTVEEKIDEGLAAADYVLTGELSALSTARAGTASDYVLVTMQLVDLDSNEILWEGDYETKRVSNSATVYK